MAHEIQFARVTNSGKLSDRFLTFQNLESQDLAKSSMGKIFALVEILSPWFPTAQIGQMIINNFAKLYYQSGSTSDLANFENALKKINENLAQITQNGETEWIGNLNSILTVIVADNIHLAFTGKVDAYLFREGKVNHLTTASLQETEPHPLKTYANIVSGGLKSHDKILITNRGLFDYLNLEAIRQIITLNSPSSACLQISKILKKEQTRKVNLAIINLVPQEEISSKAIAEEPKVFYLDKSMETGLAKVGLLWKTFFAPLAKIVYSNVIKLIGKIRQLVKKIFNRKKTIESAIPESDITSKNEYDRTKSKKDRFHQEFLSENQRDDSLLKDEEIKYSPELYVHYYQQSSRKKKSGGRIEGGRSILRKILNIILDNLKWFFRLIAGWWKDKRKRKYLYILAAVILIIIVIIFVKVSKAQPQVGNLEAQKILDEAISLQKDAKSSLVAGDNEKAKQNFLSSIDKANTINENSFVAKDAENVISDSNQELDRLTSTTRFTNLSPISTISETIKDLYVVGGQAYLITDQNIYKTSLVGGSPSKITSIPKGNGDFLIGTRADKMIYLYTSDQTMFQFDTGSEKITQTKVNDNRWETANSIIYYVNTLYLLDGVIGQIYKHTSNEDSFDAGQDYISTALIDLKESASMTIDGSIYVLKNDGEVIKIQRSKKQDFSLKNLPTPYEKITKPVKIYTDTDTPSIFILDAGQKRIIEFDKEGQFIHQYTLPNSIETINNFAISSKSRKIWFADKSNLYEISI